ncbi:hypothetical protein XU18_1653 [Perkinsela sp. CCAP 1560/4]|nr:hypothetical protein XU18_2208 [Perkinsela sp. CCAP 1560/4]KNH07762.1 hypothetical protein XU18_1653 [Perkinsela sp. CCAP 1560/4]|eukprot:KNH07091.1 hypothetical protein XU18_2208 [Perkinsela sp. CCAP 1560/4]
MSRNALSGTIQLADLPGKMEVVNLGANQLAGSLDLDSLPAAVRALHLNGNEFTVLNTLIPTNPTKGHLSVVGWTSTPVFGEAKNLFKPLVVFLSWRRPDGWPPLRGGSDKYPVLGKPAAARYYGDPPWGHRAETRVSTILHCSTRYTLWHKDALSIARERIAGDASKKLEACKTHRRRVVGIKPTKTKHLTGVRLLDCLASQARTNWSPYWGDLHRILNPLVPKACRFCSEPPGASSAPTTVEPSRKRGRTTDAVACHVDNFGPLFATVQM